MSRPDPGLTATAGRAFTRSLADTAWVVELGTDSGLFAPTDIALDRTQLYLADQATRSLTALDRGTGGVRWRAPILSDKGDTLTHNWLASSRRGGVYVGDMTPGVVWHVPARGGRAERIVLSTAQTASAMCELPDTTLLVAPLQRRRDVFVFDPSGTVRSTHAIPWPGLQTSPDLRLHAVLAPAGDGCVMALSFGVGFAHFSGGRFSDVVEYVEPTALPAVDSVVTPVPDGRRIETTLRSTEVAANDVAATPTRIAIAFGGRSPDRNHLVDVYDRRGSYVESFRLTTAIGGIAANDSSLFVLTRRRGLPVLVAFRWPR